MMSQLHSEPLDLIFFDTLSRIAYPAYPSNVLSWILLVRITLLNIDYSSSTTSMTSNSTSPLHFQNNLACDAHVIHTICIHTANIIMVAVYGMNMQRLQLALAAAGIAT